MSGLDIQTYPILDQGRAVKNLGNAELFESMLYQFVESSLNNNLLWIKISLDDLDYYNVRLHCNSLRSSAAYLYAMRIKIAAERISEAVELRNLISLINNYRELITECIHLRQYLLISTMSTKSIFLPPEKKIKIDCE